MSKARKSDALQGSSSFYVRQTDKKKGNPYLAFGKDGETSRQDRDPHLDLGKVNRIGNLIWLRVRIKKQTRDQYLAMGKIERQTNKKGSLSGFG